MKVIEVKPTVSLTAYAAGDAVGGRLEFPFAVGYDGRGGRIVGASIVDQAAQDAPLTLHLFDETFTPSSDNAAFNPSDDDAEKAVGNIEFAANDYAGGTGNSVATKGDLNIPFVAVGTSLFGQLSTSGTPTYVATNDLTVKLFVEED